MGRSLEAAGGLAGGGALGGADAECSSGSAPDYENSEASQGIDAREEPEGGPELARSRTGARRRGGCEGRSPAHEPDTQVGP
eukprot:720323-Alexandrium_andersonii.AAC.1